MSALDPRITRWLYWLAPFALLALAIGIQTGWGRNLKLAPLAEAPVVPAPVATAVAPEFRIGFEPTTRFTVMVGFRPGR